MDLTVNTDFFPTREWCFLLEMLIKLLREILMNGVQCQLKINRLQPIVQRNLLNMRPMAPKQHLTVLTSWAISDLIAENGINKLLTVKKKKGL